MALTALDLLTIYKSDIDPENDQALYDWLAKFFDDGIASNKKDQSAPAVSADQKDVIRKQWSKTADHTTANAAAKTLRSLMDMDVHGEDEGKVDNLLAWEQMLTEALADVKKAIAFETRVALGLNNRPAPKSTAVPKAHVEVAQVALGALTQLFEITGRGLSPQRDDAGLPRKFSLPRGQFKWAEDAETVPTERPSFSKAATGSKRRIIVWDQSTDPTSTPEAIYDEVGEDLAIACKKVAPGFTDDDLKSHVDIMGNFVYIHAETGRTIEGQRV